MFSDCIHVYKIKPRPFISFVHHIILKCFIFAAFTVVNSKLSLKGDDIKLCLIVPKMTKKGNQNKGNFFFKKKQKRQMIHRNTIIFM